MKFIQRLSTGFALSLFCYFALTAALTQSTSGNLGSNGSAHMLMQDCFDCTNVDEERLVVVESQSESKLANFKFSIAATPPVSTPSPSIDERSGGAFGYITILMLAVFAVLRGKTCIWRFVIEGNKSISNSKTSFIYVRTS